MVTLKISENLIRLRKLRKVTQEQLADFLGVTKASVSKWETSQSYPDILLLPVIANYFDISVDELIGFQAQLTPAQINKQYVDMSDMFASLDYDEAYSNIRKLVKQYYACYPFLLSAASLLINHLALPDTPEKRNELLNYIGELIDHIENHCSDLYIRNDAMILKNIVLLQLGKAEEVIDMLSQMYSHDHLSSNAKAMLTQAYVMNGDKQKAISNSQISLYINLMEVIGNSILILSLESDNIEKCEQTISKINTLNGLYNIELINLNSYLQFQIQAAAFYTQHDEKEKAIGYLKIFTKDFIKFLSNDKFMNGDNYFDSIDEWLDNLPLGGQMPSSRKIIYESTIPVLTGPFFSKLSDENEYKFLIRQLQDFSKIFENKK
ncbi:MAG: helix-turn-helix transcriptional regulator [Oscillospiraceae bacterium]|nr:helix-turn-helix transcriptional regulator [Oscillospiraceae bacterium]